MLLACCRQRLTFKSDILWTEEIVSFQSAFLRTSVCSTVSIISPSICHEVMGLDAMILVFWMFSFKPIFSFYSFTFIRRLFSSLLSAIRGLCIWGYWYFPQQSWFQLMLHPAQYFSWCTLHISEISRVTIHSLDILLFLFETSLLFHPGGKIYQRSKQEPGPTLCRILWTVAKVLDILWMWNKVTQLVLSR